MALSGQSGPLICLGGPGGPEITEALFIVDIRGLQLCLVDMSKVVTEEGLELAQSLALKAA